jgi:hypothetical protein
MPNDLPEMVNLKEITVEEFMEEYRRLGHAIQTGVGYEHEYGSQDGTPKHLRTGLANVMSDLGSIGRLLIAKGVITEQEYFHAILEGLKQEVAVYEQRLEARLGAKITLA